MINRASAQQAICNFCNDKGPVAEDVSSATSKAVDAGWLVVPLEGSNLARGHLCPACAAATIAVVTRNAAPTTPYR